jgi:hypothetical protein
MEFWDLARWKHFIGGHDGRLGTRGDVKLLQQYMADIADSTRNAIDSATERARRRRPTLSRP